MCSVNKMFLPFLPSCHSISTFSYWGVLSVGFEEACFFFSAYGSCFMKAFTAYGLSLAHTHIAYIRISNDMNIQALSQMTGTYRLTSLVCEGVYMLNTKIGLQRCTTVLVSPTIKGPTHSTHGNYYLSPGGLKDPLIASEAVS